MRRKTETNNLSFWEHAEDLRKKLLWVLCWLLLSFFLSYFFLSQRIISYLLTLTTRELYYLSVFEPFVSRVRVSLYSSVLLAVPVLLLQLSRFILPGLYRRERLLICCLTLVLLGLAGALGWLLLRYSPDLLEIFISSSAAGGIRFHLSISTFLLFYVMLFAADVLLILIPLLTFVLLKLKILSYTAVGRSRRVLVPLLLFLSAMVTPPDPATMIIVFLPLWVLFEISLFIFKVFA